MKNTIEDLLNDISVLRTITNSSIIRNSLHSSVISHIETNLFCSSIDNWTIYSFGKDVKNSSLYYLYISFQNKINKKVLGYLYCKVSGNKVIVTSSISFWTYSFSENLTNLVKFYDSSRQQFIFGFDYDDSNSSVYKIYNKLENRGKLLYNARHYYTLSQIVEDILNFNYRGSTYSLYTNEIINNTNLYVNVKGYKLSINSIYSSTYINCCQSSLNFNPILKQLGG
jgi:hypothetical protein